MHLKTPAVLCCAVLRCAALLQEVQGLLGDTQAAFKLLMETVQEKVAAGEALEVQVEGLRGTAEALRRARDEAVAAAQVGGVGGWA